MDVDDDLLRDTRSFSRAPPQTPAATHVNPEPAYNPSDRAEKTKEIEAMEFVPPTAAERAQQEADDMSWYEQAGRGGLGALERVGQSLGGMARSAAQGSRALERASFTPEIQSVLDQAFSPEGRAAAAKRRAPVENTFFGGLGSLATDVAATAGFAGPRVAGAASRILRGGAEGAAASAMTGGDAMAGAGFGAAVPGLTGALRRTARGIVPTTPGAHDTGTFVPIASAVDTSTPVGQVASTAYREVFPNVPGGGNIFKQVDQAYKDWRMKTNTEKVLPDWAFKEGHVKPTSSESDLWEQTKSFYGGGADAPAFGFTNKPKYSFGNADPFVLKDLQSHPKWPTEEVYDPAQGMHVTQKATSVDGRTLRTIKTSLDNQADTLAGQGLGQPAAAKYATARSIDDTIKQQLPEDEAKKFEDIRNRYGYFKDVAKARKDAPVQQRRTQGAYDPKGLFQASRQRAGETRGSSSAVGAGGFAQSDAQTAIDALGMSAPVRSRLSKMAAYGMVGGGSYLNPAFAAAPLAVRMATTQGAQNALMGRTNMQKKLAEYLRKNPAGVSAVDSAGSIGAGLLAPEKY